jgi:hypothetical protein
MYIRLSSFCLSPFASGVLVDRAGRAEAAYPNIRDGSN